MAFQWAILALAAYLLGAVPTGKWTASRMTGADITRLGSGNIGATNISRHLGIRWGLLILLLDGLKGFVPLWIFHRLHHTESWAVVAIALAPLLGHQFSVFHRLRGGKGVATALGIFLVLSPLSSAILAALFAAVVAVWRRVSLGSILSLLGLPLLLGLLEEPPPVVVTGGATAVLVLFAHRENIRRLLTGNEPPFAPRPPQERSSRSRSNSSSE